MCDQSSYLWSKEIFQAISCNEFFCSKMFFISIRSNRSLMFFKIGVFKNFAKFTGKHLCQSLFVNKVAGLKLATLLKKRLWNRCFFVNFAKFLRTPFFIEHLWWLLLKNEIWANFFLADTISHVRCPLLYVFHTRHIFYAHKTLVTESDTRKNKIFFLLFFGIYASLEPCQTPKIERFAKIVNGWKPLTIFAKCCIIHVQ